MRHRVCFAVALATALTVTAFAGPAVAATPTGTTPAGKLSFPDPGASAKEKKLAYSRYCGAEGKHRNTRKAKNRRTCLGAMARLAVGKPSSPNAACRTLKRKRSKGRKASTSAYKRCVKAGRRLQTEQKHQRAAEKAAAELAQQQADALAEQAEARAEAEAENADEAGEGNPALDDFPARLLDGLPDLDDEPVEEPDDESNEDSEEF